MVGDRIKKLAAAIISIVVVAGFTSIQGITATQTITVDFSTTSTVQAYMSATDSGDMSFPIIGETFDGEGELNLPEGASGKVPLVILAHGTAGVGYREEKWSDYLNEQGYATFVLDYFSPRGVSGRERKIPRPQQDVWGAITHLSAHPGLDMERVAVMGFSNGASVTRNAFTFFDPQKHTDGVMPKAFIMLYGGCHSEASNYFNKGYNPALLYIVGDQDKLVRAKKCLLRKKDKNSSSDLEVMVIAGAYHMFDSNKTRTINHRKWGTVELRADSGATAEARAKVSETLERVF